MLESFVNAGVGLDSALDKLHQAFYDTDRSTWGEGPVVAAAQRAMMKDVPPAPKRSPEEIEEMNRRKRELFWKARGPALEGIARAVRAYADTRGAAE